MANTFQVGQTLPATKYLKISWTEKDAQSFIELDMLIKTNSNLFNLFETYKKQVQSDFDPNDVDTDYSIIVDSLLIATWTSSMNRSPEWLSNCGENNGESCQLQSYVTIDTSYWSALKRTVTTANSNAISNLTWEDLSSSIGTYQVYFNAVEGTPVNSYQAVLPGATIAEPQEPTKQLFIFNGWYTDETYANAWDFDVDVVTESMTLYAKWTFDLDNFVPATEITQGAVVLSSVTELNDLQENDKVITETAAKRLSQELLDDLIDALDEV